MSDEERTRSRMLTIRQSQVDALSLAPVVASKARLAALVARHWPEECAGLGAQGVHALVERAFEACARRGLAAEPDIGRYLNVMVALGEGFEDDPRYPWARATLDAAGLRPSSRLGRLCALVGEELAARAEAEQP